MYNKILLPIDGTKHSEKTIDYAINMAKSNKASIVVIHAVELSRLGIKSAAGILQSAKLGQEENAKKLVAKVIAKLKRQNINATGVVVMSKAEKAILSSIETEKPDVVVMGSHSSGTGLGSTARRVLRQSSVPVMVVK